METHGVAAEPWQPADGRPPQALADERWEPRIYAGEGALQRYWKEGFGFESCALALGIERNPRAEAPF